MTLNLVGMNEGLLSFLFIFVQMFQPSGIEVPTSLASVDCSVLLTCVLVGYVAFVATSSSSTRLFADWTVIFGAAWGTSGVRPLELVYYLSPSSLYNLESQSWHSF